MSNFQNKKEQFTNPQKSKLPIFLGIVLVIIAVAVIIFISLNKDLDEKDNYFGEPIVDTRSYIGKLISMTTINPELQEGKVVFPLEEVDNNNILYFELENDENVLVPIMAYITPSGRLFVGSSMCEPCRGRTFSLAGETIVCDTCKTTYNIETHEFISGAPACGKLPPINMNPKVENGNVIIDYNEILNWRIRV
ncbi:MAG: hypothetical protein CVV02_11145 [Firmicutes bacterium HGW-Firmicutes-7]|nr:MAG: hypothetical protein CVV02_11145 [Firmicutes bacterium HGW-Firmicutes-7]